MKKRDCPGCVCPCDPVPQWNLSDVRFQWKFVRCRRVSVLSCESRKQTPEETHSTPPLPCSEWFAIVGVDDTTLRLICDDSLYLSHE